MRIYRSKIIALISLIFLSGCSDTSFKSSDNKGDSKKDVDNEDDQADMPVQVSGAYLTCDWIEDKKDEPGQSTLIGCGVYDKTGTIFPKEDHDFQLSLYDANGSKVEMKTSEANQNASFHRYAKLPTEFNGTGYLKMSVRKGSTKQGDYQLSTTDIGMTAGLGNEEKASEYNSSTITDVTSHAYWPAGNFGFTDKITTKDFCKGGKITSQLSTSSQAKILAADILTLGSGIAPTTKVTSGKKTFSVDDDNGCFVSFKADTDKSKQFAQQSEDGSCLFLRFREKSSTQGDILHIVKVGDTGLTLNDLRSFAAKATCK